MRILWLTIAPLDSPGFRSTQFGMATALEKLGFDMHLMGKSNSVSGFEGFQGFKGAVTLIKRRSRLLTELSFHFTLWMTLFKNKYDTVIFEPPQLRLVLIPALLAWLGASRTLFVLDVRTPPVDDAENSGIYRLNYWLAMRFSDIFLPGVTFITDALREDLKSYFKRDKKYAVWGSGVDTELFDPHKTNAFDRSFLSLENRLVFFYHGSLSAKRGLPELIRAMKKLADLHPEAALVLLGDGIDKRSLEKLVSELGLEDTVLFIDAVDNARVPSYIAMADMGVVPLPQDRCWEVSSPLKLFEYMAMELPVVVSNIEAHRTVLGNAPFAIYADEVTVEGLFGALREATQRFQELRKHSSDARRLAIEKHSWMNRAAKLRDFLEHI